jgi:hypothetical protein
MAVISYGKVMVTERAYENHYYSVERYVPSGKINLRVSEPGNPTVFLKMSLAEAKDLIIRLQFAVHEAENKK